MKTIASYSIKGGVGKTALAVNLAYALADEGRRVLLVDLDPQCAAAFYFRVRPSSRVKLKTRRALAERLAANVRASDYERLDILPSNLAYRNFDIALDRMKKSRRQLAKLLSTFEGEYDVVVLDAPPNITLLSENIFHAADLILVPVIPTPLSRRTLEQLEKFFARKKLSRRRIVPFFSMVQSRNRLHREMMDELRQRHPAFLSTVVPFTVQIERMGLRREPVLAYAPPKSRVRVYEQIGREVVSLMELDPIPQAEEPPDAAES